MSKTVEALREVERRIVAQQSCSTPPCHDGCYVAESLAVVRDVLARHAPQPCGRRYIAEKLADAEQDARMACAREAGHSGLHRNAAADLGWASGAEISIRAVLSEGVTE